MARTKEFDPHVALDAALELFWSRGYQDTSTADLLSQLGIARASLYDTFGSKHELFVRALDRYRDKQNAALVVLLNQPGPVLPALRAVFEKMTGADRRGCLVTNTAAAGPAQDAQVCGRIEASWTGLETLLVGALLRAGAQGELAEGVDPTATARMLLVLMQGIKVVGRGSAGTHRLADAVRATFDLIS